MNLKKLVFLVFFVTALFGANIWNVQAYTLPDQGPCFQYDTNWGRLSVAPFGSIAPLSSQATQANTSLLLRSSNGHGPKIISIPNGATPSLLNFLFFSNVNTVPYLCDYQSWSDKYFSTPGFQDPQPLNLFFLANPGTPKQEFIQISPTSFKTVNQGNCFYGPWGGPCITTPFASLSMFPPYSFINPVDHDIVDEDTARSYENLITDSIDTSGKIKIVRKTPLGSAGASGIPIVMTSEVPMTNCVKLGGNGTIKVIFVRGKSLDLNDFLWEANNAIENGFKAIDPYKTYINQFSFYVDLKGQDDSSFPVSPTSSDIFDLSVNETVRTFSKCGQETQSSNQYIFLHNRPEIYYGFVLGYKSGVVYYNVRLHRTSDSFERAGTFVHEFNHAFVSLLDEYIDPSQGTVWNLDYFVRDDPYLNTKNCSKHPSWEYRGPDNIIYGSVTTTGCRVLRNYTGKGSVEYYRPSLDSLMNKTYLTPNSSNQMNVISCGYVIAAIKGEELIKANAAKYFKECNSLDTVKRGIPPLVPVPPIDSVTVTRKTAQEYKLSKFTIFKNLLYRLLAGVGASNYLSMTAGDTITVSGSGFTSTDNSAQLVNTTNSANIYDIDGISSADLLNISFDVPTTTPAGTYYLKVGAFNSPWTPTLATLSIANTGVVPPPGPGGGVPPPSDTTSFNFRVTNVTSTSVTFMWNDVWTNESNFVVKKILTPQYVDSLSFARNTTSARISGLTPGTEYTYMVCTEYLDIRNGLPECSEFISFTTLASPTVITITLSGEMNSPNSVSLTWSPLSLVQVGSGYSVSVWNTTPLSTILPFSIRVPATEARYIATGLQPNNNYCFSVSNSVIVGQMQSIRSNEKCFTTPPVISTPANFRAITTTKKQVQLSWSQSSPGPVTFEIERLDSASLTFTRITTTTALSYTDTNLIPTHLYTYRIRSKYFDGSYSPYSSVLPIFTIPLPSKPDLRASALSPYSIGLTWSVATDEGIRGYNVSNSTSGIIAENISGSIKSYTVAGLQPNTRYCHFISPQAYYTAQNSRTVCVTTQKANATAPLPPSVTSFTASPPSVTGPNDSITLSWSATNASMCTASGGWTGAKLVTGSEIKTSIGSATTFTLTCTGTTGTTPASRFVTVSLATP